MEKINYNDLNSKQKENYNYHKVAMKDKSGKTLLKINSTKEKT